MTRPALSVVMPNYNHAAYLPETIEQIAGQSRPPDEFLILDDASTDDSLVIIRSFADRYPFIRVLENETNQGVIRANQRLFAEAKGDYLHAAAADDVRHDGFFQSAMQMAEEHPQAGVIFGKMAVIDSEGRQLAEVGVRRWQEPLYADPQRFLQEYLNVEAPSHSAVSATIFRRQALDEVGGYLEPLGSWADSFAVRAIGLKYGVCYLPQICASWRRLTDSFSAQGRDDARHTLDLVERAAYLMRSDRFRDLFPPQHVRRWRRLYRLLAIRDDWRSASRSTWPARIFSFFPRVFRALRLACYRGDVSCFDQGSEIAQENS